MGVKASVACESAVGLKVKAGSSIGHYDWAVRVIAATLPWRR